MGPGSRCRGGVREALDEGSRVRLAAVGGLHPQPARAVPHPRRQPARAGRHHGLRNARDVYTRRQEGVSIWVVPAASITASSPEEKDSFFDPAGDKVYRHPTFYDIPDEVRNL